MTKTKTFLSVIMIAVCLLCVFTFAGCNEPSTSTILENIEAMNTALSEHDDVFNKTDSQINDVDYYSISYGSVIDGYISSGTTNYTDLENFYNTVFSLSMSYIEENYGVITNLTDEELNSDTRGQLEDLNNKIVDFTNSIQTFVEARNSLASDFSNSSFQNLAPTSEVKLARLREFKREYVTFVDKSVQLSQRLSSAVDSVGMLDSLEELGISNVELVKNTILNKLLPAFHNLYVNEIGSFNFYDTDQTTTRTRIENVIENLKNDLTKYVNIMQLSDAQLSDTVTTEEISAIREEANIFYVELNDYLEALDGLDIRTLSVNHDNDLESYMAVNDRAEIYLQKVEQFVEVTLSEFLDYLESAVTR